MVVVMVGALLLGGCEWFGASTGQSGSEVQGDLGIYRIVVAGIEINEKKEAVPQIGSGTGFLINDKNVVATNRHVVTHNGRAWPIIKVMYINKGQFELVDAEVIGPVTSGQYEDLAFLRPVRRLPGKPVQIADYAPAITAPVKAIGFPGAADTVLQRRLREAAINDPSTRAATNSNDRVVSILNRYLAEFENQYRTSPAQFAATQTQGVVSKISPYDNVPVVQHQAPINPGNSGGPLFDACDNVIGINTFFIGNSQGIFMSLGSQWVAERARAAGHDVRGSGRCLAAGIQNYIPFVASPLGMMLFLMTGMLMTSAGTLYLFRRTSVVQRGMTMLTRRQPNAGHGMPMPPRKQAAGLDATIFPGGSSGGGRGTVMAGTVVTPQASQRQVARLIPTGGGTPITIPTERLNRGAIVGRDSTSDIIVDEKSVSKRHAKLTLDGSQLKVEDLNSANGTWKGRDKISREALASGDVVKFGSAEYRVELPGGGTRFGAGNAAATVVESAQSNERSLLLSGLDPDGRPVQINLRAGNERTWSIGRKVGVVDHVINHPRVSSEHAEIRYRPGRGFEISDKDSTNGTFVDGVKISRNFALLDDAKKLKFGDFEMSINKG